MTAEYRETSRRVQRETPEFTQGAKLMTDFARSLERQGLLPKRLPEVKTIENAPKAVRVETIREPLSEETQRHVEQMRKDGYVVYDTEGKTPSAVRAEGMPFWYINTALENVSATPALFAFKPKPSEFFLKGSQNKSHEEQLALLDEEKEKLEKKYPDAGLILREGQAPEWAELAWMHFQATDKKKRLFGRDYNYNWTWTNTYENDRPGAYRAVVSSWREASGLDVGFSHPDDRDSDLRLAPLVEIPRK